MRELRDVSVTDHGPVDALEELLSTYLNTRVKVDIQNRRGRLVVEFATLEDLERIYRAMVGDGGVA